MLCRHDSESGVLSSLDQLSLEESKDVEAGLHGQQFREILGGIGHGRSAASYSRADAAG